MSHKLLDSIAFAKKESCEQNIVVTVNILLLMHKCFQFIPKVKENMMTNENWTKFC